MNGFEGVNWEGIAELMFNLFTKHKDKWDSLKETQPLIYKALSAPLTDLPIVYEKGTTIEDECIGYYVKHIQEYRLEVGK